VGSAVGVAVACAVAVGNGVGDEAGVRVGKGTEAVAAGLEEGVGVGNATFARDVSAAPGDQLSTQIPAAVQAMPSTTAAIASHRVVFRVAGDFVMQIPRLRC
jgi:hypothetical protein